MKRRRQSLHGQRGFVLLLVILVLAALGALATALAVVSRQQSQTDRQREAQVMARQHARVALRLALAQLQRVAGPDDRATAVAGDQLASEASRYWTGVWGTADRSETPMCWLVSGGENTDRSPPLSDAHSMASLMTVTDAGDGAIRAPILATAVSGKVMGGCAWWIGDEGVKASIASNAGAAPLDESGRLILEPRAEAVADQLPRVTDLEQLSFFRAAGIDARWDRAAVRSRQQTWTVRHRSVLSDPIRGGLKRDLCAQPQALGRAYAAWTGADGAIEDPAHPSEPRLSPDYGLTPMRRRYRFTPMIEDRGIAHGIAPVLSYFLLSFNVRTDPAGSGTTRSLEARARWLVSLWNPYSSALVPEDLLIEVEHLPEVMVVNDTNGAQAGPFAFDRLWGTPLRLRLPWVPDGRPDRQSWFPGRVHTWAAKEDLNKAAAPPAKGFAGVFYTRTLTTASGQGVQRSITGTSWPTNVASHLSGPAAQLTLRLYRVAADHGPELLRTFVSPVYSAFVTPSGPLSGGTYQLTYVFHLAESSDTPSIPDEWLTTAGRDPREPVLGASAFASGPNGPHPELYPNYTAIAFPDRLLDRALPASASSQTGQSYNEDVPLFELPRAPLESVGDLQHLALPGARPFAVGNSWGAAGGWNELFDRHWTSGWTAGNLADPPVGLPPLRRAGLVWLHDVDGSAVPTAELVVADVRAGWLAGRVLQEGAFNINSTDAEAWHAFLRSARRDPGDRFAYVSANVSTGTGSDEPDEIDFGDQAVFGRFSSSAAETYRAEPGFAASSSAPPAAPNVASKANTHLFRRGLRVLSVEESGALAETIAALVREKRTNGGPFRSLADFLGPQEPWGGQSVLEAAIARTETASGQKLNDRGLVPEFSSQTLLPSDLMSRLGGRCTIRSDTFRIRSYGEARNPITGAVSARAWAEALVQRLPVWFDPTQAPETATAELNSINRRLGRQFRVVSFRWLRASQL